MLFGMLTLKDLKDIDQLLEEKVKYLPTKQEFFGKMDEVVGELKAMREEVTLLSSRQSEHSDTLEDHETRIGKLEKKAHPSSSA